MGKGKKGKKQVKNKVPSKRWTNYKIEGDKASKSKNCPKCGPGIFLAKHKDRAHCGKCGYTTFEKKNEQSPKKEPVTTPK